MATRVGDEVSVLELKCTHMGCNVAFGEISGRGITCPCCGSQYDLITGEVLRGPAQKLLRKYKVTIIGDEVQIDD